jgi:hypothetical protein
MLKRTIFALVCAALSAAYLFLSFHSAPPELWTPYELVAGSALYGPFLLTALFVLVSGPRRTGPLPWKTLGFLMLSTAWMANLGYNMAGALVGLANLIFAWVLLIRTVKTTSKRADAVSTVTPHLKAD